METKKGSLWITVLSGLFCMVGSVAAGSSLTAVVERFNGWQAAGYAAVAGIFIACVTVIINMVLTSLTQE